MVTEESLVSLPVPSSRTASKIKLYVLESTLLEDSTEIMQENLGTPEQECDIKEGAGVDKVPSNK